MDSGFCRLNFYANIALCHESLPCRQHPLAHSTGAEAERVANAELVDVQKKYGAAAGNVVLDETGLEVTSGGGQQSHA